MPGQGPPRLLPQTQSSSALLTAFLSHLLRRRARRDGLGLIRTALLGQAAAYQQVGRPQWEMTSRMLQIYDHWFNATNALYDLAELHPDAFVDFCLRGILLADPPAA